MAIDVAVTASNLQNRVDALSGKTVSTRDWVEELLVHVILLERICVQQQEEINSLKKKNLF